MPCKRDATWGRAAPRRCCEPPVQVHVVSVSRQPNLQPAMRRFHARWLSPIQGRFAALRELWVYRLCWKMPKARARLRSERDREMSELVPVMVFYAVLVAAGLFVAMPLQMGDRATPLLEQIWPVWVVQIAPMLVAMTLAMVNTPSIALQLVELEAQGAFEPTDAMQHDPHARSALISLHLVPIILGHSVAGLVCVVLLVAFTLVGGLLAGFVLAAGDFRTTVEVVFRSVSPLDWLHMVLNALLLATACNVTACAYAWPGTHRIERGLDMHRLGVRTMMVSFSACLLVWLLQSGLASLIAPPQTSTQTPTLAEQAQQQPGLVGGVDKAP